MLSKEITSKMDIALAENLRKAINSLASLVTMIEAVLTITLKGIN